MLFIPLLLLLQAAALLLPASCCCYCCCCKQQCYCFLLLAVRHREAHVQIWCWFTELIPVFSFSSFKRDIFLCTWQYFFAVTVSICLHTYILGKLRACAEPRRASAPNDAITARMDYSDRMIKDRNWGIWCGPRVVPMPKTLL